MYEVFDLIGSLDDKHLEAAARIVNVAIKDRQEKQEDEEMLAALTMMEQASSKRTGDTREPSLPQSDSQRIENAHNCNNFPPLCDDRV